MRMQETGSTSVMKASPSIYYMQIPVLGSRTSKNKLSSAQQGQGHAGKAQKVNIFPSCYVV